MTTGGGCCKGVGPYTGCAVCADSDGATGAWYMSQNLNVGVDLADVLMRELLTVWMAC